MVIHLSSILKPAMLLM